MSNTKTGLDGQTDRREISLQERAALEAALDTAKLPWGYERGACVAAFEAGYRAALAAREEPQPGFHDASAVSIGEPRSHAYRAKCRCGWSGTVNPQVDAKREADNHNAAAREDTREIAEAALAAREEPRPVLCGAIYDPPSVSSNTYSPPTTCRLPAGHDDSMHRAGEMAWPR